MRIISEAFSDTDVLSPETAAGLSTSVFCPDMS